MIPVNIAPIILITTSKTFQKKKYKYKSKYSMYSKYYSDSDSDSDSSDGEKIDTEDNEDSIITNL